MPAAGDTLVTLEEYARMPDPDDGTYDDLIEGVVVHRPLSGGMHGVTSSNACAMFWTYKKRNGGSASLRCGLVIARNPDTVTGPDVSYWKVRESVIVDHGWPTVPPDAAFDIVDAKEPYPDVMKRVRLLTGFGIPLLWLVDPFNDAVTEFRGSAVRLLTPSDTLDGGDVLPGFACKVADLFA